MKSPRSVFLVIAALSGSILTEEATAQCSNPWVPSGANPSFTVYALATLPAAGLAVGGIFNSIGGAAASNVAAWDGSNWQALGGGVNSSVAALAVLPNGNLVAAGNFTIAGGTPCNRVARWNGSAWSPLGAGLNGYVTALAVMPNGDLIAGGTFPGIAARWNGTSWSILGSGLVSEVRALTVLANGTLVAATAGYLANSGPILFPVPGRIVRWTGVAWADVGGPFGANGTTDEAWSLAAAPNGDLYAGGYFSLVGGIPANHAARWNGTSWSALGSGPWDRVSALAVTPGGHLVATGFFQGAGTTSANYIARWDGAAWSPFGVGLSGPGHALLVQPNGDVAVGGQFQQAGGQGSRFLAFLTTTCPATTAAAGTPCVGAAGAMTLTATALPWLGTSSQLACTGIATGSLAFGVLGFTADNTPLSQLHPAGLPGCHLLTTPDLTFLLAPAAGSVRWNLPLLANPALVGMVLRTQVLGVEIDAAAQVSGLVGSNGLLLTVGSF